MPLRIPRHLSSSSVLPSSRITMGTYNGHVSTGGTRDWRNYPQDGVPKEGQPRTVAQSPPSFLPQSTDANARLWSSSKTSSRRTVSVSSEGKGAAFAILFVSFLHCELYLSCIHRGPSTTLTNCQASSQGRRTRSIPQYPPYPNQAAACRSAQCTHLRHYLRL